MSIRMVLRDRVDEGRLIQVCPIVPATAHPRSVWATEDVYKQLDPLTADHDLSAEAGRLRRKLDNIVTGKRLVAGDRKVKSCDIKHLDPYEDEVWEIRETNNPSIRIFFRFSELDCLIATNIRSVFDLFKHVWMRNVFEYLPVWNEEIRLCKARWRNLFHNYPAHNGDSINDYISNTVEKSSI